MKNWKSLFVKTDEKQEQKTGTTPPAFSFPITTTSEASSTAQNTSASVPGIDNSLLNEVIGVYEKGIDSINMPGYDFYEFYKAISSIPQAGEQVYAMAFQMAKSMDSNISPAKLMKDAEFYISKINEVHSQYVNQGQSKLNAFENQKNQEKNQLLQEIEKGTQQIAALRNQLQALEADMNQKRLKLSGVDNTYSSEENEIRQKLLANDHARNISVSKLTLVKEGIQKNIKN